MGDVVAARFTAAVDLAAELRQISILATLSSCALRPLAAALQPVDTYDGQVIMLEGDADAPVFFVIRGAVRAFRTGADGREQNLIYLGAGQVFNMPAAFSDQRQAPVSAVAVGATRLLSIDQREFCRIVTQSPELSMAVLRDLSSKLYHLTNLTHNLSLRSVRGRLAQFLLAQAQADHTSFVRWTHEEIAAQIGTVREVVSRTMRTFVQEGLIQIQRQRIVVLCPDALKKQVES